MVEKVVSEIVYFLISKRRLEAIALSAGNLPHARTVCCIRNRE